MEAVRASNHEKCVPQIHFDLHPRSPTAACPEPVDSVQIFCN